jgi:hypothetical protein
MSENTSQGAPSFARGPIAAVLAAIVAAVVIWAVASAADVELSVNYPGQPIQKITIVNVVIAALVGSLAGWGLLALLRRFTTKARTIWTVIAIVAALLSLGGPLSAIASPSTKVSLVAMHLAVATVLIVLLRRNAQTK